MLDRQPNNVSVTCLATFEPSPSFMADISAAAAKVCKRVEKPEWVSNPNSFTVRNIAPQMLCSIQFNQLVFQLLGFDEWSTRVKMIEEISLEVLSDMRVKTLKRLEVRAQAFLDLQMSHSELVDLTFGTFLNFREELAGFGEIDDSAVTFTGTTSGFKFRLQVLPQTIEHVKTTLNAIPNVELFNGDRFTDTTVQRFFGPLLGSDRLCVDTSIFAESEPVSLFPLLIQKSPAILNEIVGRSVRFLKGVKA